jgi:hypothetical protein
MTQRICRCCGEPIPEQGNALSRNPNICASCSSMADGMGESNVPECAAFAPAENVVAGMGETINQGGLVEKVEELVAHHVPAGL